MKTYRGARILAAIAAAATAVTAVALSNRFATGDSLVTPECSTANPGYAYKPYDFRCSVPFALDLGGNKTRLPDTTLGPTPGGVSVTFTPSLAGSIASLRMGDGTELVHSPHHGSAFTFILHPDTLDRSAFPVDYTGPKNKYGETECYNPTEEGSAVDNVNALLARGNEAQGHGLSSSRVGSWASGVGDSFEWFRAETLLANYWPESLGPDPHNPCVPPKGHPLFGVLSRFKTRKTVTLGSLKDAVGQRLAGGFPNYLTIDRFVEMHPSEPNHQRIAASEVFYLASRPDHSSVFNTVCVMKDPASARCEVDPAGRVVSWNRLEPVIVSDASGAHAIGSIADQPVWVNAPASPAILRYGNLYGGKNGDAWANMLLEYNWFVDLPVGSAPGQWIGRVGKDGNPLVFRARQYLAVGTRDQVAAALAEIRARMQRGVAIQQ